MFNLNHSFFRPFWLRILIVAFVFGWSLFELITGSPGWAIMFGATCVYTAWNFFINFNPLVKDKDNLNSLDNKDVNNG